ncbi:hypothetical protein BUALT_Bualt02G0137200 [Buddleja alternifolia]|uniref:HTH myb-type domain-containing protein n=1 Tax=Buddleja alternifolia TaxID=168488 RepID=A0AAV6Y016_9LAMI|nr:hypothetical protein BUALT_Bualt02G0137200 [Buddleja alternifolia]
MGRQSCSVEQQKMRKGLWWAQIATQLPGRTDNEIKNLWNSSLKKKLIKQGIDPNTHKPITQTQDSILQTQGLSNPSSPTRVETFATKQVYDLPVFLSEFQETTDHHGFHSKFPFHFQQNPTIHINPSCGFNSSMPNSMEADYSDSSASRISAYMMNEVKESSSSSTFSWEAENKLRNKCSSDESLFFSGIHTEESSGDFDNNPFTLFSEEFFQQM